VGLAGLAAGLRWIGKKSLAALKEHDQALSRRFLERIRGIAGLTLYGPTDPALRVAVFSVRVQGFEPAELSAVLETEFGLLTRSGIHCAPLAHQTIGTHDDGGTTRLSFGAFNTLEEADRVADSLLQLVASNSGAQRA
jgi:selenocysteine lyase/cysteine desulfurase